MPGNSKKLHESGEPKRSLSFRNKLALMGQRPGLYYACLSGTNLYCRRNGYKYQRELARFGDTSNLRTTRSLPWPLERELGWCLELDGFLGEKLQVAARRALQAIMLPQQSLRGEFVQVVRHETFPTAMRTNYRLPASFEILRRGTRQRCFHSSLYCLDRFVHKSSCLTAVVGPDRLMKPQVH